MERPEIIARSAMNDEISSASMRPWEFDGREQETKARVKYHQPAAPVVQSLGAVLDIGACIGIEIDELFTGFQSCHADIDHIGANLGCAYQGIACNVIDENLSRKNRISRCDAEDQFTVPVAVEVMHSGCLDSQVGVAVQQAGLRNEHGPETGPEVSGARNDMQQE